MTNQQQTYDKYESRLAKVQTNIEARIEFIQQFLGEESNPLDLSWRPGETARKISDTILELASLRKERTMLLEILKDLENK